MTPLGRFRARGRPAANRGVTLVEVLAAMIILGVIIAGGMAAVRVSAQYALQSRRTVQAAEQVSRRIEELRNLVGSGGTTNMPTTALVLDDPFELGGPSLQEGSQVTVTDDVGPSGNTIGQTVVVHFDWQEPE